MIFIIYYINIFKYVLDAYNCTNENQVLMFQDCKKLILKKM